MQMLGNGPVRATMLHASAGKTQAELAAEKNAKRAEVCDAAVQMNDIYDKLQNIYADQRRYGEEYRLFAQPDTGVQVNMSPETLRLLPIFKGLRNDQFINEEKQSKLRVQKANAVAEIQKLNRLLMDIENKINTVIDTMTSSIRGKLIAIPVKPYEYISNDGRTYFQI